MTPMASARARWDAALGRYDSLTVAQQVEQASALLDSLDHAAQETGDQGLAVLLAMRRERRLLDQGRLDEAERSARFVLAQGQAMRDTATVARGWIDLGDIDRRRLRNAEAQRDFEQAIRLARHARLTGSEALAQLRLGYLLLYQGRNDGARRAFALALELSEHSHDDFRTVRAQAGLARAYHVAGRYDQARRAYDQVLAGASRRGEIAEVADTYAALAELETSYGDPDTAADFRTHALVLHRSLRLPAKAVDDATGIAEYAIWRDAPELADSVLSAALQDARALPDRQVLAQVLVALAEARRLVGRDHDAEALVRGALALSDSVQPVFAVEFVSAGIGTLVALKRYEAALAACDSQRIRLGERAPAQALTPLGFIRGVALSRLNRPREALPLLRAGPAEAADRAGSLNRVRVMSCAEQARCYRALGQPDRALAWYRAATDAWERGRASASREESRAMSDVLAESFSGDYLVTVLDPARGGDPATRAMEAFDVLQRFRAAALAQALFGPPGERSAEVGLASGGAAFRRSALRRGDLLVEIHSTADTTVLISVTSDGMRAWFARGGNEMGPRLERFRDHLADPRAGPDGRWRVIARALGEDLFGPARDLLASATRVYLSAGGLARYPLGSLIAPGGGDRLAEERVLALVSAANVVALRPAGGAAPAASGPAIVAYARSALAGRPALPAAAAEVRDLARRYDDVVAWVDPDFDLRTTARAQWDRAQILHFATHAYADAQQPWRSGLLIADPAGPEPYLRSAAIARMRVRARLCVMASCRTIGGAGPRGGLSLQGLAPAWLAAGTPTVVASLWDVDDAATAALVRSFYDALARGRNVAAALAAAQREVRARPEFAAPAYWAGFVVVGDPETRVTLVRRP